MTIFGLFLAFFVSVCYGQTFHSPSLWDPEFSMDLAFLDQISVLGERIQSDDPWDHIRLSENILPLHYDLWLHPNVSEGTFTGEVRILLHVVKPTDHICVHQHKLNISSVRVLNSSKDEVSLSDHFYYNKHQLYVLKLNEQIQGDQNYSIELKFQGGLLDKIVGFYRSDYFDSKTNQTRYLATTHFEPTNARRAFPCFDEPGFKSRFTIHLIHEKSFTALSNMDVEKEELYENTEFVITSFRQSVPMPTYIVCFIVCEFEYSETFSSGKRPFRVYSRPDEQNYTALALETGALIQDSYEKYFDIAFPLPKQDFIAIPDFSAGAMENWGLITYRESRLLYNQEFTNLYDKQFIVKIIAHELTHQWFGNLVTMKWWDDIWLNEGFASFFAYHGLAFAKPDWHTEASIIIEDMQRSFRLDNRESSHPIVQHVEDPGEIAELFDEISYSKGASVIRMLEGFMGSESFQAGIRDYLKRHQFGHARTQDLWNAMNEKIPTVDVAKVMDTWTLQMGFPVVHIQRTNNRFNITQQRYLIGQINLFGSLNSPFNYLWEIPLSYVSQAQKEPATHWIHREKEVQLEIPSLSENQWIKFNTNTTGYYRVNYDINEWKRLVNILIHDPETFSISDRVGLLDDAFALAEAGYLPYDIPLDMTLYLKQEKDYEPWITATSHIRNLGKRLLYTPVYSHYRTHFLEVVKNAYERLGWTDTGSHTERLLRSAILNIACALQQKDCLQKSSQYLQKWLLNNELLSPNLINVILNYGLNYLGPDIWDQLWSNYLAETSAQNKMNLLKSLASTRYPWQISTLLEYALNISYIRTQNFPLAMAYISANPTGEPLVWNFVRSNWKELVQRFGLGSRYLGNLIPSITSDFRTEVQLIEMQQFFDQYPDGGAGTRSRVQALDNVKTNINWLEHYKNDVAKWLSSHLI